VIEALKSLHLFDSDETWYLLRDSSDYRTLLGEHGKEADIPPREYPALVRFELVPGGCGPDTYWYYYMLLDDVQEMIGMLTGNGD